MMNRMRFFSSLITAHRSLGALASLSSTPRSSQHPSSAGSRAKRLYRVAVGLLLAVVLGLAGPMQVSSASTQSSLQMSSEVKETTETSHWSAHFDRQIAHALKQEPSMHISSLRVVIEVALENEHIDLSRTVGALLNLIKRDSNSAHRLMAVQALHHIGPEHVGKKRYRQAMHQLYTLTQGELPEEVRVAAEQTLSRYAKAG